MKGIAGLEVPIPQSRVKIPAFHLSGVEPGETRVVHIMKHLLNAQKVSRSGVEAAANPQQPHISPLHETERGLKFLGISRQINCAAYLSFGYSAEKP